MNHQPTRDVVTTRAAHPAKVYVSTPGVPTPTDPHGAVRVIFRRRVLRQLTPLPTALHPAPEGTPRP